MTVVEAWDVDSWRDHIEALDGVVTVKADGDFFFFYGEERKFPFATIVTGDRHDEVSNLNRPGVFRLNVGVGKATFRSLFGEGRLAREVDDFAALDRLMPHPVYGKMYWVCVLNPAERAAATARALLREAYDMAVAKASRGRAVQG